MALSLGLRRAAVSRHSVSVKSGLSSNLSHCQSQRLPVLLTEKKSIRKDNGCQVINCQNQQSVILLDFLLLFAYNSNSLWIKRCNMNNIIIGNIFSFIFAVLFAISVIYEKKRMSSNGSFGIFSLVFYPK